MNYNNRFINNILKQYYEQNNYKIVINSIPFYIGKCLLNFVYYSDTLFNNTEYFLKRMYLIYNKIHNVIILEYLQKIIILYNIKCSKVKLFKIKCYIYIFPFLLNKLFS